MCAKDFGKVTKSAVFAAACLFLFTWGRKVSVQTWKTWYFTGRTVI